MCFFREAPDGLVRTQVDRGQRGLPAEPEVTVFGPDREALPLAQEGEVGRLLELGDEDARADCMWDAGGHVDDVARTHRDLVQRVQEPVDILVGDPREVALGLDRLTEADPDVGLVAAGVQNDPRLRLPELRVERLTREGAIRVRVHRQPLGSVEQLHEHARRRAEPGDMGFAQPPNRIGLDRVAEDASTGEAREAFLGIVATGIPRGRHGAEPVLRKEAVLLGLTAQPSEERSPSVEAVDAGRLQRLGTHRRKYPISERGWWR